ncbi:MAG: SRPBCC family protein [Halocynthiibacter sp.]
MKFKTSEDVEAPANVVFDAITDFDGFERMVLRRGADVDRLHAPRHAPSILSWDVTFKYRGKLRNVDVDLVRYVVPEGISIVAKSGNMSADFLVDLVPLSKNHTRMIVSFDMKAKSLGAKLFVQSIKLARNTFNKKFAGRVARFAREVERQSGTRA